MPEMMYIDSTSIEAIGYDPATRELHVRFLKSGETYVYYDVEYSEFEEFKGANSKGVFLNQYIRSRHNYAKL